MRRTFAVRVREYLRRAAKGPVPFRAIEIRELASGVIVVLDTMGTYDVYFDRRRWNFRHPEIWRDSMRQRPLLDDPIIRLLPGVGTLPSLENFAVAAASAHRHLQQRTHEGWYHRMRILPLPTYEPSPQRARASALPRVVEG